MDYKTLRMNFNWFNKNLTIAPHFPELKLKYTLKILASVNPDLDDDRLSQLTSNSLSLFAYQKPVLYAVIKFLMGF